MGKNKFLTSCTTRHIIRIMSNNRYEDIEKYSDAFKALSNPNRLKIYLKLLTCCTPGTVTTIQNSMEQEGFACVGELGEDLGIAPSTISHHIKELRRAGLIRMEREGQKIKCWTDSEMVLVLKNFFTHRD
jgi:ArsR family transcriptional regulator, arsenate/arsenite/antimonite-responsive transcriptional repressor